MQQEGGVPAIRSKDRSSSEFTRGDDTRNESCLTLNEHLALVHPSEARRPRHASLPSARGSKHTTLNAYHHAIVVPLLQIERVSVDCMSLCSKESASLPFKLVLSKFAHNELLNTSMLSILRLARRSTRN